MSHLVIAYLPLALIALVGLGLLTLLMHPGSFMHLPSRVLDNSTGLRTMLDMPAASAR